MYGTESPLLIEIVADVRQLDLKPLSLPNVENKFLSLEISQGKTFDLFPVVEGTLREGFAFGALLE
jgi:hypothetical protein